MTYETLSMESFHKMSYSIGVKAVSLEDPVDLSCKKVPSPSSPASSESDKDSSVSPLRGSTYVEPHEETNNNDSKSLSGYHRHHHQPHKQNDDKDAETAQHSQSHHYHQDDESSNFSSSNHERKSAFESRPYVMTPPSDTTSPKKSKFQPIFEHASSTVSASDGHPYPSYPILPMGLSKTMPVPSSISAPPAIPALMTSSSLSHSQISTSAETHAEPVKTSTPVDDTKKAPRPFKAYPKDALSISLGTDMMFDQDQKQAYCEFRSRMLESVKRTNEGTNIKMRRISKSPMLPTSTLDDKDAAYWERRRKNNEAAKRSRDARRAKEDEIAIRAAFLEQEFLRLKYENSLLKEENSKLSKLVYGS